ncbi:MAG: GDP-L-fucose synthase [Candidatus Micrarchaeota archaeon]
MDLKDKTILVTGGHGFLGKPLIKMLENKGAKEIIAPKRKEYNLVKEGDVKKLFEKYKPDVVIHAAARVGGIEYNRKNPGSVYYENAMMNNLIVHYSYLAKVKKFVGIGSVCAYPKIVKTPTKEEMLWDGYPEETNAPYGMAKKMMLVQLQAYREQYGFDGVYLLQVNLYGPGDHFNDKDSHVIGAMVYKFDKAKEEGKGEVVLWGDGSPTREFLYVDDAARAIVMAAEKLESGEAVNIGSGEEISIKKLAEIVSKEIGYEGEIKWDTSKPNGQPRRLFDSSKAKKLFGFEAKVKFNEGLKKTIEWYMENKGEVVGK